MVINVGQAGGRAAITPERIAINFQSGSTPDNSGKGPKEGKIEADGADGYFTQLPIQKNGDSHKKRRGFLVKFPILQVIMCAIIFFMNYNTCEFMNFLI